MNATKKAAGTKRAAFAIEDAIAETRKRITASPQELQRKAQAALASGPRLQTEKDGRLFAMDALDRANRANADEASAYPFFCEPVYTVEDSEPFRKGPQWDGFKNDLFRIFHEGTEAAQLGFASIVTCVLADGLTKNIDFYRAREREGKFQAWGTPGNAYKRPKVRPMPKSMLKAQRKFREANKAKAK